MGLSLTNPGLMSFKSWSSSNYLAPSRLVACSEQTRRLLRASDPRGRSNTSFLDEQHIVSLIATRLEHCIKMHKRLFKVDVKKIGGDTGYAGMTNRELCKELGIQTSFVKRGRPNRKNYFPLISKILSLRILTTSACWSRAIKCIKML